MPHMTIEKLAAKVELAKKKRDAATGTATEMRKPRKIHKRLQRKLAKAVLRRKHQENRTKKKAE